MRRPRLPSEEQRRQAVLRQGDLTALTQHPSWPALEAVLEEKRASLQKVVLAEVLGGMKPVNQTKVLYWRGFLAGMGYMVSVCNGAEARLEEVLRDGVRTEEAV